MKPTNRHILICPYVNLQANFVGINLCAQKYLPLLGLFATVVSSSLRSVLTFSLCVIKSTKSMDLSPFRQNFEKNRNRQKYHHSLKEHPTFTKIAKFGCEML